NEEKKLTLEEIDALLDKDAVDLIPGGRVYETTQTPLEPVIIEAPKVEMEPTVEAPTAKVGEDVPEDFSDFICMTDEYREAQHRNYERLQAQKEECAPILATELRKLMAVTPKLQLHCFYQGTEKGKHTSPSGVFDNPDKATEQALYWNY